MIMSQQEENQKKVQELETAKNKLSDLIDKLKENPSLTEDEIAALEGGGIHEEIATEPATNGSCPNYVC